MIRYEWNILLWTVLMSGQVEYLLSIGVKDVDLLDPDTSFSENFRSGEWPVKPRPLLNCPMPYRD